MEENYDERVTTDESQAEHAWRGHVIAIVKYLLFALALWFVGKALFAIFREAEWESIAFRPLWLLGAAAMLTASTLCMVVGFRVLYRGLGHRLSLSRNMTLYSVPLLGTYVPGRVLAMAGHAAIARAFGVPLKVSTQALVLLMGMGIAAALLCGAVLLFIVPFPGVDVVTFRILAGLAVLFLLAALHPRVYFGAANFALRKFGRQPVESSFTTGAMARLLFLIVIYVLLYVAGFMLAAMGMLDVPIKDLPVLAGIFCVANTIAFLAIFAPGGIGVREGLLLVGLTPVLGRETAGLIAVGLRLVQVVYDVGVGMIGIVLLHRIQCGGNGEESPDDGEA